MPGSAQRGVVIIWRGKDAIWQMATGLMGSERERGAASSSPLTGNTIQMFSKCSLTEETQVNNHSPFLSHVILIKRNSV